jgi:hypothetical protein
MSLPSGADENNVVATYEDGILEVRVAMVADQGREPKRISGRSVDIEGSTGISGCRRFSAPGLAVLYTDRRERRGARAQT